MCVCERERESERERERVSVCVCVDSISPPEIVKQASFTDCLKTSPGWLQ